MVVKKIPTLLNYTRSIVPSEAVFYAKAGQKLVPLLIGEKTELGTIGSYSNVYVKDKQKTEDAINKEMMAGGNNPQRNDFCHLPIDCDTFRLKWTVKCLSNSTSPQACNDEAFFENLENLATLYKEKGGYRVLAEMYFANLINGRFLWRNRYGTNRLLMLSAPFEDLSPLEIPIADFDEPLLPKDLIPKTEPWLKNMVAAFSGEKRHFVMEVNTDVTIGSGQEVYPSQEFVNTGDKSKTLFSVKWKEWDVAGLHSQKIGNAIRTIDIWYPGATNDTPLAIDPFTVNKRKGKTVRLPEKEKSDFYSYLKNLDALIKGIEGAADAESIPNEAHYFMAVLIRGGVFSGESKKKKPS